MSIIDRVTVSLNLRYDEYEAQFSNLGLGGVPISEEYPEKFDRHRHRLWILELCRQI